MQTYHQIANELVASYRRAVRSGDPAADALLVAIIATELRRQRRVRRKRHRHRR